MPIIMNVGPSAISAVGASGGGQTLGNAQGSITINVHNVAQANKILQESAKEMEKAFNDTGKAAQRASKIQIAESRAAAAQAVSASKQKIAADRAEVSSIALKTAQTKAATKDQLDTIRLSTTQQVSNSKVLAAQQRQQSRAAIQGIQQQTSQIRAAAAASVASGRQQIAINRVVASSNAVAAAQQAATTKQQIQNARLATTQQQGSIRALAAQQKQQSQAALQGIQQQIASNRLIVSAYAAQNAAIRATAAATRAAAQQAVTGWQSFHQQVNKVRTELFGVAAASTLITGFGLQSAAGIQEARIQLKAMTGGVEEAAELMDSLQKRGRQAGIPFKDMLTFATQLLPVLEGNTQELITWFDIVRRTAVLNRSPTVGGVAGATFSLREAFLSVQQGGRDFVSLADRFNISKKALQEALKISGGDFIEAMDLVLDQMGITTEMADEMGKSFNASFALAQDGAFRLAAEGFEPLISVIGPALQASADFMATMRQGAPSVLGVGAAIITLTAVSSSLLLVINQLTVAWARLGVTAQASIAKMSRIGAVAALGAIGVGIGIDAGTFFAERERERKGLPPLSEVTESKAAFALFNALSRMEQIFQRVNLSLLRFYETVDQIVVSLLRTLSTWTEQIAQITPIPSVRRKLLETALGQGQAALDIEAESAIRRIQVLKELDQRWEDLAKFGTSIGIKGLRGDTSGADDAAAREKAVFDRRRDIILEWGRKVEDIERDSNRARIDAAIDYGRRVNQVNFSYNQSLTREAEDFARQRLRQEQQIVREILKVQEEAARREAEWREDLAKSIAEMTEDFTRNQQEQQEDHDDKIAEIKEDSDKKLLELEEDYQKDREKALRDHRDTILEAASRLDAAAVFEEQKRFAREQQDREENHRERVEDEKEGEKERIDDENRNFEKRRKREQEEFDRRLKQEQEGFEERLREAREADQRRLFDMHEAFEIQREEEDEDRAIRLARMAEDHEQELIQMQLDHDDRMAEINRQEAEKLESLKQEHEDDLEELGLFNQAKDDAEEAFYRRSLLRHEAYFKDWEEKEKALMEEKPPQFGPQRSEFQSGGFVKQTGLAKVHAGEFVINPGMTRILRDMLNGGFSQASMMSSMGGGSRSNSVIFQGDVKVSIMGSTNMGENQMYSVARKAFTDALEELAN